MGGGVRKSIYEDSSNDIGMDAIDALLCLGYVIRRNGNKIMCQEGNTFLLVGLDAYPMDSIEGSAVHSLLREVEERPEHHKMLIQQKGLASGN